ncbi:MAG: 8-amino-7-oxononanoate synthase [Planctomycetaceae bacterium]|nr:8-amino-7-oxononanoate synthase [Planctomycetaceae bacterium]
MPWLSAELDRLRSAGLLRTRRRVVSLPEGWCQLDDRRLRNMASNDYLNLAHDPRLKEAAQKALMECGVGSTASALVTGRSPYHEALEQRLARFEGQDSAVLFPSGYAANVGTITALIGNEDVIYCDRLNHASLIDGCRLSGAKLRVYRHTDLDKLKNALGKATGFRRRWIVTDSVFSMDGDAAPLKELADLAEQFEACLFVDEAHATGLFGTHGRGIAERDGAEDRVAVRVGTLSKALGTLGGFVAGPSELTDWLWNQARSQMFSTALPPAVCAAACAAVEIVEQEPERRRHVLALAETLRTQLLELGLSVPERVIGPIVPILFREVDQTLTVARQLEENGVLVAAIRPPTVPQGTSRIRITLTAAHNREDVSNIIKILASSKGR